MRKFISVLVLIGMTSCLTPQSIVKREENMSDCRCEGEGTYTIVMDAGLGNWSLFYEPLLKQLIKDYKVCLIDRDGYGGGDTISTAPNNLESVALKMNAALLKKEVKTKMILVGHSLGGLHVRKYQELYPEKVVGMVLLDAAHPKQFEQLPSAFYEQLQEQPAELDRLITLAEKGYLKYGKKQIPTFGLPNYLHKAYYDVVTKPVYYYAVKRESIAFANALNDNFKTLGDLPLLVIGSENSMDIEALPSKSEHYPFDLHNKIWLGLQKDLAKLSSQSTFATSKANHYLHLSDTILVYELMDSWLKSNF